MRRDEGHKMAGYVPLGITASQLCVIQLAEHTAPRRRLQRKMANCFDSAAPPPPPPASRQILSSSKSDLQFIILGLTKLVCVSHFEQTTG